MSEPGHKYEGSWTQQLNQAGYTVCALDFQGHGRSGSEVSSSMPFAFKLDDLVSDVRQYAARLKASTGLPLTLIGQSMGGCVALHVAASRTVELHSLVLISPAAILPVVPLLCRPLIGMAFWLLRLVAYCAPLAVLKWGSTNEEDPHISPRYRQYMENGWFDFYPQRVPIRAGALHSLLVGQQRLSRLAPTIETPCFIAQGTGDTITPPGGAQRLHDALASEIKVLRMLPSYGHRLHRYPGNQELLMEMVAWLGSL